jgi:DNA polymerase-3 subunit epsilon
MTELMLGGAPLDTLALAREKRPGKRNSLDALCREYKIDASERQLHGALLDAELLTLVYLAMTREQSRMFGGFEPDIEGSRFEKIKKLTELGRSPHIIEPSDKELQNHKLFLDELRKSGDIFWDKASS